MNTTWFPGNCQIGQILTILWEGGFYTVPNPSTFHEVALLLAIAINCGAHGNPGYCVAVERRLEIEQVKMTQILLHLPRFSSFSCISIAIFFSKLCLILRILKK